MKIKQFEVPGLAQYSYVISSAQQAVVIDPMRDIERYMDYAAEFNLAITAVTETHIHADFASGALALAQATGAELALSAYDAGEQYRYAMDHRKLRDGDDLRIGNVRLSVLHTPGHTPEHLSFILFEEDRNRSEPSVLFSGNFLFVGSLGRPDLLGAGEAERLADELYSSLHERIAFIPDGALIYPGHGAGSLCGAGMSERAESTLGYERATQPLFQLHREEFVRSILNSVPPMPSYYPRMKALNAHGARPISDLPAASPLSAAEFSAALSPTVAILDLRRPEAFGGAHIPGAINIGAGPNLSLWAGWILDPEKSLLLVDEDGDPEASRCSLLRVGMDRVIGYLAKGMTGWIEAGLDFSATPQISVAAVRHRESPAVVVDVRSDGEWHSGHIPGAQHIPLGELPTRSNEIPRDCSVTTVCGSGYRSSIAGSLLQQAGRAHVSSMHGGMSAWKKRALPLATD